MPGERPHLLHLHIDDHGWLSWSLDCPYSATEVEDVPGRPCNLLSENSELFPEDDLEAQDEWSAWVPVPGCFAKQYLEESGEWDNVVQLGQTDPSFPVKVKVIVQGHEDDAWVAALTPWDEGGGHAG